jgi:hypothetical protein
LSVGGFLLQDEVVRISRRGRKHDDHGDEPVLEKTGQRRVEWAVAGEEAGVWQDALTTELLDDSALGEDHRQNVTEGGQRNEYREGALGSRSHDIAEERGCEDTPRREHLIFGHRGEVSNVGEHIEDSNTSERHGSGEFEGTDRVLRLGQSVVCVGVPDVGPDDIVEGGDNSVRAACRSCKGIVEVVRIFDFDGAPQSSESGKDDDQEDSQLDGSAGGDPILTPWNAQGKQRLCRQDQRLVDSND